MSASAPLLEREVQPPGGAQPARRRAGPSAPLRPALGRAEQGAAGSSRGPALSAATIFNLQRLAGNSAVAELLARARPVQRTGGGDCGCGCGGTGACGGEAEESAAPAVAQRAAEDEATTPGGDAAVTAQDPEARAAGMQLAAADPRMCQKCLQACKKGGEALNAFCRSLPDPRLRAGCWALQFAGTVACNGWCYWHFCD